MHPISYRHGLCQARGHSAVSGQGYGATITEGQPARPGKCAPAGDASLIYQPGAD